MNPNKLYFLGHEWEVLQVSPEKIPETTLCVSDWQQLQIKITNTLSPAIMEEVLIHEVIELTTLNCRIVENIKDSRRSTSDDADYVAECLDSAVQELIRFNPSWFPITRGVDDTAKVEKAPKRVIPPKPSEQPTFTAKTRAAPVCPKARNRLPETLMDTGGPPPEIK